MTKQSSMHGVNAVLIEELVAVAKAARTAPYGEKNAIYESACARLRLSKSSLAKKLKELTQTTPRKQRNDAGLTALTYSEALLLSGVLIESARKNEKRLYSINTAVNALRANGLIKAAKTNPQNPDEILNYLSISAISRALKSYKLHPEQLLAPAPCAELASRHPNHVWQIDASLCVLYYLSTEQSLQIMNFNEFYKNKPKNLAKISANRVWSYEITDHASGWVYVEYVLGAESGENLCSVLINAMQERGGADILHGVPKNLMLDAGSANTAAMTKNLCSALGINLLVHGVGNARATGQVENARNIIERQFESGLKFLKISSLEQLNAEAKNWRMHFNATQAHARHGMSRSAMWMKIRANELVKAPNISICRDLAISTPVLRKVSTKLRVSFLGDEYDVSSVPNVMVNEWLRITRNPWREMAAQVMQVGSDGREVAYVAQKIEKNEYGFSVDAAIIGESYKTHADTNAQTAKKAIEQLITGTTTAADALLARKNKELPLSGKFNPYQHIDNSNLPSFLPRRGSTHALSQNAEPNYPDLSHIKAALELKARLGQWQPQWLELLKQRFPNKVPFSSLDDLTEELKNLAAQVDVVDSYRYVANS